MGNPNDFAMMIIGESASGNFGTFDEILRDQRDSLRQLRAHHRQTIELAQSGIRLHEVRTGLEHLSAFSRLTALAASGLLWTHAAPDA
jgi:hypothetical protein